MSDIKNQYKFNEGETHPFTITGYTEIPGTDESFYILVNPFGGKHLLKAIHYKHYGLKVNQKINCKIDKINCSGKIYLEPENPVYKENKTYTFELAKISDRMNSVGREERVAIVKDHFGNEVACSVPDDFMPKESKRLIKCKVLRIKKGLLFLSSLPYKPKTKVPRIGERDWFTIKEIKPLENNVDYYILKDSFGNFYSLKKSMYTHYGFSTGDKVECTVTKYGKDGLLKIEPEHPHYKVGKTYSFKYLKTIHEINPLGKEEKVIVVKDIYGVETKVRSLERNVKVPIAEYLDCKVDGIRKGKAILSLSATLI